MENHPQGQSPPARHPRATAFSRAFEGLCLPEIDDFRESTDSLSLLVELVSIDMELRPGRGATRTFAHYLDRYPQLASRPEIVSQLAMIDIRHKRDAGVTINPRDYPVLHDGTTAPAPLGQTLSAGGSNPAYQRLREIGRGGMSVVYLARQSSVNRLVALKVLRDDNGGFNAREVLRFLAEAESIASIRHPHVVQIHDFGAPEGFPPYLALEYLSGGTLSGALAKGPMPPVEAALLVANLASAIQAAHSCGIIHRDLKPGNVIFDETGVAKVIDFGLAKREMSDLTLTQSLMGTPAYMAPEQADRNGRFVGPGADIWALGAILYECLAGSRPFTQDDSISVLHAIRHESPANPRARNPSIPLDLERICLKCLEKDPLDRYPSAEALEMDLRAWLNNRPISLRKPTFADQAHKWVKRNRALAAAMSLAAAALILATVVSTGFGLWAMTERGRAEVKARDSKDQRLRADAKALAAERDRALAASQRDRAEVTILANRLQSAERAWEAGRPEIALSHLDNCRWDLRGPEYNYLFSQFNKGQVTFHGHRNPVTALAISPDKGTVFSGDTAGNLFAWSMHSPARVLAKSRVFPRPIGSICVNPANSEVAVWSGKGLKVLEGVAGTGNPRLTIPSDSPHPLRVSGNPYSLGMLMTPKKGEIHALLTATGDGTGLQTLLDHPAYVNQGHISHLAASHDGSLFAVARASTVCIHDTKTKKRIGKIHFTSHPSHATAMDFSPEGSCLAVAFGDGSLRLCRLTRDGDVDSVTDLPNPIHSKATILALGFTPDARYLLTAGDTMVLTAWDWRRGRIAGTMMGHRMPIRSLAISRDGRFAVTGSEDCTIRVHDLNLVNNSQFFTGVSGDIQAVAASADGKVVAALDRTTRTVSVMNGKTGGLEKAYSDPAANTNALAVSGNGRILAMACHDGSVRVVRLRTGRYLAEIPAMGGVITTLALDDTGGILMVAVSYPGEPLQKGLVRMIDIATGADVFQKRSPGLGAIGTALLPRYGQALITGDSEGKVLLWDWKGETTPLVPPGGNTYPGAVRDIAEAPGGGAFATAHATGKILSWETGNPFAHELASFPGDSAEGVSFLGGSRILACVRKPSGRVTGVFQDFTTGTRLLEVVLDNPAMGAAKALAVAGGVHGPMILVGQARGLSTLATDRTQDIHWLSGATAKVRECEVSRDGKKLTARLDNHPPLEWDLSTGQPIGDTADGPAAQPRQVECAPLSRFALATEPESRKASLEFETSLTAALARADLSWHMAQAELARIGSSPHAQAFHLAKARSLGPWTWGMARQEWDALERAGKTPLSDSLRRDWVLDLLGRSLAPEGALPDPRRPARE